MLAIDPLAQLAGYEAETLSELRSLVENDSAAVKSLWEVLADASRKTKESLACNDAETPAKFFVLIECADEDEQRELLERFEAEGLKCQAKIG